MSVRLVFLVALAIGAYLPALQLPFISDDYHQIPIARHDAAAGWEPLRHDPLLRSRFTYMLLSAGLDRTFGFQPLPFYAASIFLHVLCTLALYSLSVWKSLPRATAFWAAAFFAVQEGHQEAVMWLASSYDLFVFASGVAALAAWIQWLNTKRPGWYAASFAAFVIAAASKETFFVFALLMLAVTFQQRRGPQLLALAPFFAITAAYLTFMWFSRFVGPSSGVDTRFALTSAFPVVFIRGIRDLLFPYGFAAVAILLWKPRRTDRVLIAFAVLWIALGILPHSFLTYMPRLASRHTYLASGGLAILFGVATARLSKRIPAPLFVSIVVLVAALNIEIIWVKKLAQFQERAEPTELLKAAANHASGPITVNCTPVPAVIVDDTLASVGGKAIQSQQSCRDPQWFAISYRDRSGAIINMNRRIGRPHGAFY